MDNKQAVWRTIALAAIALCVGVILGERSSDATYLTTSYQEAIIKLVQKVDSQPSDTRGDVGYILSTGGMAQYDQVTDDVVALSTDCTEVPASALENDGRWLLEIENQDSSINVLCSYDSNCSDTRVIEPGTGKAFRAAYNSSAQGVKVYCKSASGTPNIYWVQYGYGTSD